MVWEDYDPLTGSRRDDVLMAQEDARRHGLRGGDPVLLRSDVGEFRGRVRLAPIAPRNLSVHWPEANALIRTGHYDPSCGEPDYNAVCEVIPLSVAATTGGPVPPASPLFRRERGR